MQKSVLFDVRTKIVLLLTINLLLLLSHSLLLELILIGWCLIHVYISGQKESAFHFLLVFLVMLGMDKGLTPFMSGFSFTLVSFVVLAIRKFLPCIILGKWILTTTEVSEFVAAMWKLRLPQTVVIPLSVVFRYFPTLKEEWMSIRGAMKLRGIHLSFEHVLIPILMSAVNVSEELSAAALCRGLDNPGIHTCMNQVGFRTGDKLSMLSLGILTVAVVVLKGVGIL